MSNLYKLRQDMDKDREVSPFYERVQDLLDRLDPHGSTWDIINEMFSLHNEMFPQIREHSTFCDKCRARVYRRLVRWHEGETAFIASREPEPVKEVEVHVQPEPANQPAEGVHDVVQEPEVVEKPKRRRKKAAAKDSQ